MNRDNNGRLRHPAGAPSSLGGKYAPDSARGGAAAAASAPTAAAAGGVSGEEWDRLDQEALSSIPEEIQEERMELTGQRVLSEEEFDHEVRQYLETQLWAAGDIYDEEGESTLTTYDEEYDVDDFPDEVLEESRAELASLIESAPASADHWRESGHSIGRDFALTRNRHGAGFWDRHYDDSIQRASGDRLTDISHPFGENNVRVGDDGKLCLE